MGGLSFLFFSPCLSYMVFVGRVGDKLIERVDEHNKTVVLVAQGQQIEQVFIHEGWKWW